MRTCMWHPLVKVLQILPIQIEVNGEAGSFAGFLEKSAHRRYPLVQHWCPVASCLCVEGRVAAGCRVDMRGPSAIWCSLGGEIGQVCATTYDCVGGVRLCGILFWSGLVRVLLLWVIRRISLASRCTRGVVSWYTRCGGVGALTEVQQHVHVSQVCSDGRILQEQLRPM